MAVSSESSLLCQPTEIQSAILSYLNNYDVVFVRATCKQLLNQCRKLRPFPKYFVLDQFDCLDYLCLSGFTSCIEYVRTALRFDWNEFHSDKAAINGQLETLKYLIANGCPFDAKRALLDSRNTYELTMVEFLLQNCSLKENEKHQLVASVARQGSIVSMQYIMQNVEDAPRKFSYAPTIEFLEFAIQHGFDWTGVQNMNNDGPKQLKKGNNICQEAALHGNLAVLKYAHEKGVDLENSACQASKSGHVDCLIYAIENDSNISPPEIPKEISNLACFKYLLDKYGVEEISKKFDWSYALRGDAGEYFQFAVKSGIPLPSKQDLSVFAQVAPQDLEFILDQPAFADTSVTLYDAMAFTYENLMILENRNRIEFTCDITDSVDITTLYDRAVGSKDVRKVQFVWEIFQEIHLVRGNFTLCVSTPEIVDFMAQKGYDWSKHLHDAVLFSKLPNLACLFRLVGSKWNETRPDMGSRQSKKYARDHGSLPI